MDGEGGTGGAGVSGDGAAGAGAGGGGMGDAGARGGSGMGDAGARGGGGMGEAGARGGGGMGDAGARGGGGMGDAGARGGGGMREAGARGGGRGGRARLLMQLMLASDDSDDDDTRPTTAVTRAPGPKKKKSRGPWSAKRAQLAAGPGAARPGPRRPGPGRPGPGRPGPGKPGPGTPGRKGPGRPRRSLHAPAAANRQDTAPGNSRDTYARNSHRPNGDAPAARRPAPAPGGGAQPPPATHNGTDSSNSLMDWLAQDSSCSEDAPSGELVQLAVTRVHAPAPSSRSLLAVLAHAASAPAQAALLLECLPEVSAAPAQTRVTHALCRAGDEPMRDYRFQEPETPPPGGVAPAPARAALVQLADAEREWSGELARLRAQTAAHAHTLRDVRAVCTAPPPPSGKLRAELDELLRCVKDYHDALNDVHTSREAGEAALEDAVQQALLRAVAGLEKDSA